jgi:hypothetical protein
MTALKRRLTAAAAAAILLLVPAAASAFFGMHFFLPPSAASDATLPLEILVESNAVDATSPDAISGTNVNFGLEILVDPRTNNAQVIPFDPATVNSGPGLPFTPTPVNPSLPFQTFQFGNFGGGSGTLELEIVIILNGFPFHPVPVSKWRT